MLPLLETPTFYIDYGRVTAGLGFVLQLPLDYCRLRYKFRLGLEIAKRYNFIIYSLLFAASTAVTALIAPSSIIPYKPFC